MQDERDAAQKCYRCGEATHDKQSVHCQGDVCIVCESRSVAWSATMLGVPDLGVTDALCERCRAIPKNTDDDWTMPGLIVLHQFFGVGKITHRTEETVTITFLFWTPALVFNNDKQSLASLLTPLNGAQLSTMVYMPDGETTAWTFQGPVRKSQFDNLAKPPVVLQQAVPPNVPAFDLHASRRP